MHNDSCLTVPDALCCITPPAALCCESVPSALCCIVVEKKATSNMTYMSLSPNCCLPSKTSRCAKSCAKTAAETKPITLLWGEAVACNVDEIAGTVESDWKLSSVAHSITLSDGTALTGLATDPVLVSETISRHAYLSRAIISGGTPGESYRVVALATFTDCDGNNIILEYCVGLNVAEE